MPKRKQESPDRTVELLEKMLAFQLYAAGVGQTRIAKMVGKSNNWANALLKGLPNRGRSNG